MNLDMSTASDLPLAISVLLSTRDRASLLEATLDSLSRQVVCDIPWEVIVVDNGSSDGTPDVLRRAAEHLPLVALSEEIPGKNRALNRAIDVARGRLLVFTDDDIVPSERWLLELWEASRRWPEDAIFAGPVDPIFPPSTPDWLTAPSFRFGGPAFAKFRLEIGEGPCRETPIGPNLAMRASVFREFRYCENVGPAGRDYAMGSEAELLWRLRATGYRFIYVPVASVGHVIRSEQTLPRWLYGRAFRYGRGCARRAADRHCRELFGVPRHLWRKLAIATVQSGVATLRGGVARHEWAIEFHRLRGMLYEYRLLNGAGRRSSPEVRVDQVEANLRSNRVVVR